MADRDNPPVHSKGETFHGKPHAPGHVSKPGGQAPLSLGSGHPKPAETTGHMAPRHIEHPHEKHVVSRHVPDGTPYAESHGREKSDGAYQGAAGSVRAAHL